MDRLSIELHRNDWATLRDVLWGKIRHLRRGQKESPTERVMEALEIALGKLLAGNPGSLLVMELRPGTCELAMRILRENARPAAAERLQLAMRECDE